MSALGNKYECVQCGGKFYDLGRRQAICPSCGTDQADGSKPEDEAAAGSAGASDDDDVEDLDAEDDEEDD